MPIKINRLGLPKTLKGKARKAALEGIGAAMLSRVQLEFRLSKDPYGQAWKPLSPNTIKKRRKQSAVPLVDTGAMRASVSYTVKGTATVIVGVGKQYAIYHQTGTKHIPRRQILPSSDRGLPDKWALIIKRIVAKFAM